MKAKPSKRQTSEIPPPKKPTPEGLRGLRWTRAQEIRDDLNPQIYNRRYFKERLQDEVKRFDRHQRSFSLIIADLDHFKDVNDTHRHLVGDQTLSIAGEVIKKNVRDIDIVSRYGGDEFTVILPEADEMEAKVIAERIWRGILDYPWERDLPFENLSISVGVATYRKGENPNQFFDHADEALYFAKNRGRNQVFSYDSLTPEDRIWEIPRIKPSTPILVGREKETLYLQRALEKTFQGEGSLVMIGGEAGIGKTTLVSSMDHFPQFPQIIYLKGRCNVETRTIPYYPFIEAFSGYFKPWGEEQIEIYHGIQEVYRSELAKVIPRFEEKELKGIRVEIPPDRLRLFEGFHLLMETMCEKKPLVLFIDDLHWADETSLDLLHYIARRVGNERVLILGTYRKEEVSRSPLGRVIRTMQEERLMENLELDLLSPDAVHQVIESAFLGEKVSREFTKMIGTKTGGNPLFIMEILRSLREEDRKEILEESGSKEVFERLTLPESIKEMIQRRIEGLGPESQEILTYSAIVGKEIPLDILLHLTGKSEGNLLDLLDRTVENYLLEEVRGSEGERYRFHHPLMGDVIYSGTQGKRKKLLHRRAGEVMEGYFHESLEEVSGDLARHFYDGEDYPKAFLYARRAGDRAKRIYANEEAIDYYSKALDSLEKMDENYPGEKFDILLNRSEILGIVGRTEERRKDIEEAIDLAKKMNDKKRLSDALITQSHYYLQISDFRNSLKTAEKALKMKKEISDKQGEAKALQRIGSASTDLGDTTKAIQCHEEAVKICRETKDRIGEGANLFSIGVAYYFTGDLQKAKKFYEDSLKIFQETGEKWRSGITLGNIGVIYSQTGDDRKALQVYHASLRLRSELGNREGEAGDLINIGLVLEHSGKYLEALEKCQKAVKINQEIGHKAGEGNGLGNIGSVYNLLGDYSKALEYYEKTLRIRRETGDRRGESLALNNLGGVYENLGNNETALEFQKKAFTIAKEMNSKTYWIENSLSSIYAKKGSKEDLQLALRHSRDAIAGSKETCLPGGEIVGLSHEAIAHLLLGNSIEALKCSNRAVSLLEKQKQIEGLEESIYFNHFKVLQKNGKNDNAYKYLRKAYDEIMKKANWIDPEEQRKRYLTKVRLNREIIQAWESMK